MRAVDNDVARRASRTSGSAHTRACASVARAVLDLLVDRRPLHRDQRARRARPAASTTAAAGPAERPRGRSPRRSVAARAAPRPARGRTSTWSRPSSSTTSSRKRRTPQQRLDQGDPQVGPGDRQHQPGQARRPSRCRTPSAPAGSASRQHRAVQQVPVPQPRHLAGADQATHDAVGRQQRGVPLGQREPVETRTPSAPPRVSGARRVGRSWITGAVSRETSSIRPAGSPT